jgi:hypothetical protein
MFSPSPSSPVVFQREMLPHVTLGIWFMLFGHLVPNFGIGMSVNFPRDVLYMNRFCICTFLLVISFRDSPWRKDGWLKARRWIPRVMDFLRTFAVAIVEESFPSDRFQTHRKGFPWATGFPRVVATVLVPLAERSASTAQSECLRRGMHHLADMPRILAVELCQISPRQCILPQRRRVTVLVP